MEPYFWPLIALVFLLGFGGLLIPMQAKSTADRGHDTSGHSGRVYTDYDLYIKVMIALTAGFGFVRFEYFPESPDLARQALIGIGAIGLLVSVTFCVFVICHLGSKLRRWKNIEWGKSPFWQELWACISMWLLGSGIWVASHIW